MCGLVGMMGSLEHKHKVVMKEMIFLDSLRGMDSTGLSSVKRDRTILTRKFAVPGYEFIQFPVVDKAMVHGDQLWLAHNRFKTTGSISRENAHPFEVYDEEGDVTLVGAHNGTLSNKFEIDQLLKDRFETDSEALFNLLEQEKNTKRVIGGLRGAWSLVWWDPTEDALHFCRNKDRPMIYAFTKDRKVLIWASEAWMIINACRRNGVELEVNDKGMACWSTAVDTLYTFDIPQEKDAVIEDPKKEGGYSGAPERTFRTGWTSWWNDDPNDFETTEQKATPKGAEKSKTDGKKDGSNVITLGYPVARGYKGEALTQEELKRIKEMGCAWCGDKTENGFGWLDERAIVCHNCMYDRHPKTEGNPDEDPLDDDPLFDIGPYSEESPEYRKLIENAARGTVG